MLENIKKLKIQAMKDRNKPAQNAYNAVITECQNFEGRIVNKKKNVLTEKSFAKILKKEIGKYEEMIGREYEVTLLSELLPAEKVQLTPDEIGTLLNGYTGVANPKAAMTWLDNEGYEDRYNKGLVAKLVLKR